MTAAKPQVLLSQEDASVNFVFPNGQEARYVRRREEYAIVYLSSHGGCDQACRFCHLTQTKQVEMVPTTTYEFLEQARHVLAVYTVRVTKGEEKPVKYINFNWMARGEPLLNQQLIDEWSLITDGLREEARKVGVEDVRFNVSTIMPVMGADGHTSHASLAIEEILCPPELWQKPTIYYSLYSMDPAFRKRWLPKAMDPNQALDELALIQKFIGMRVVIHHCLIEGENDNETSATAIGMAVTKHKLSARFNLVRYNPFSEAQGKEPPAEVFVPYFQEMARHMSVPGSNIVQRVGRDVYASCGTFYNFADEPHDGS